MFFNSGSANENIDTIWVCCRRWYDSNTRYADSRFGQLQLGMFTDPNQPLKYFPKLKGRAGEIKALVPAMAQLWQQWMTPGDDIHEQIKSGLVSSAAIDDILTANSMYVIKHCTRFSYV